MLFLMGDITVGARIRSVIAAKTVATPVEHVRIDDETYKIVVFIAVCDSDKRRKHVLLPPRAEL